MRGDSLRDFYAKTLAVLGLGLLACAGAIVDYWPVSGELPTAPAVSGLIAAMPVVNFDPASLQIPAPVPVVRHIAPRPADFLANASIADASPNVLAGTAPAVTLDNAPMPTDFVVVVATTPAAATVDEVFGVDAPAIPDNMTEDSRRMLSDAVRRTKVGIAAARLFLNDAMTAVGGAFRKVSPFFQTSPIVPGLD